MDILLSILLALAILVVLAAFVLRPKKKPLAFAPLTDEEKAVLATQVPFYQQLAADKKITFQQRVQHFLGTTAITGVNTTVTPEDKILVAASAIIPIFNFPDWEYIHLNEVLLYPDSFNHDFEQQGNDRSVLGMVGSGAMNGVMILSQHELRQAFLNKTAKTNTAIHEFVHLVDKTDGSIDGVPAFIAGQQYIKPWLQLMQAEIKKIADSRSDINPYGATSEAEFFAVVSEYFFERPDLLKQKHPELFSILSGIFGKPATTPAPAQ